MIETATEAFNALFYFFSVYTVIDRVCSAFERRVVQTMTINQKEGDK